eukprot:Phypoly_transcript_16234.p1 GENE.Phypoly_transcript_16234~~Phypoly_transcript_16234.p1  ORF type:complete len:228 (+),score=30.52 Phypoly_transcript_16234:81-686(+)
MKNLPHQPSPSTHGLKPNTSPVSLGRCSSIVVPPSSLSPDGLSPKSRLWVCKTEPATHTYTCFSLSLSLSPLAPSISPGKLNTHMTLCVALLKSAHAPSFFHPPTKKQSPTSAQLQQVLSFWPPQIFFHCPCNLPPTLPISQCLAHQSSIALHIYAQNNPVGCLFVPWKGHFVGSYGWWKSWVCVQGAVVWLLDFWIPLLC